MHKCGEKWFVTITLRPKAYKYNANRQHLMMRELLREIGDCFWDQCEGAVELTDKGNIHFHGLCIFINAGSDDRDRTNRLAFINYMKKISRIDIQRPHDIEKVQEYIKKDLHITAAVMNVSENQLKWKFVNKGYITDQEYQKYKTVALDFQ